MIEYLYSNFKIWISHVVCIWFILSHIMIVRQLTRLSTYFKWFTWFFVFYTNFYDVYWNYPIKIFQFGEMDLDTTEETCSITVPSSSASTGYSSYASSGDKYLQVRRHTVGPGDSVHEQVRFADLNLQISFN